MNAAFLLVTSAWLAGQPAAPPAKAAAPAPAVQAAPAASMAGGSCCGGDCDACCESGRTRLCDRLKGLFQRNKGNDCCDTCAAPAASSCCDDGCGKHGGRLGGLFHRNKDCGCDGGCGTCNDACDCGSSRMGKLRGLFHRNKGGDCCDTCCDGGCGAAAPHGAPAAPALKPEQIPAPKASPMPKGAIAPNASPMKQVQVINPALEAPKATLNAETETKNNPFELHRRYESRVSNAPDYSSVTGQLFYVHADGGLWVLRYAPLWKEDLHGGSIVLARDLQMDGYREGDLVTVRGQILSQKSSAFLGGPLYRAQSIQLVDRDEK